MFEDSHEWVLFLAGRDLGKTTQPVFTVDQHWASKLQSRISRSLTGKTRATWEKELGYTLDELRGHLERQFVDGMNWANYAGYNKWGAQNVWVIDHVVPKVLFSPSESAIAFCLSNLRPLWAEQNFRKAAHRTHLL